jgi:hypothetical protein
MSRTALLVASAIMVRKTLEELCKERNATGPNLKERIKALGTKVVLPEDLLVGLDDLRLLGMMPHTSKASNTREWDRRRSRSVLNLPKRC